MKYPNFLEKTNELYRQNKKIYQEFVNISEKKDTIKSRYELSKKKEKEKIEKENTRLFNKLKSIQEFKFPKQTKKKKEEEEKANSTISEENTSIVKKHSLHYYIKSSDHITNYCSKKKQRTRTI